MITNTTDHVIFIYSDTQLEHQKAKRVEHGKGDPKPRTVGGQRFTDILSPGESSKHEDAKIVYDGTEPEVSINDKVVTKEEMAAFLEKREQRKQERKEHNV